MTKAEVEQALERAQKATPGPGLRLADKDWFDFLATARTDVPALGRDWLEKDAENAALKNWIRAANKFAWAHERGCPRHDSDASCECGLDDFLGRPRLVIESYDAEIERLKQSDSLRAVLIRDVLHRFDLDERQYYGSGGFSLLEEVDQTKFDIYAKAAEIERLRRVCGEAYQLAGAVGAPVAALDNLSDAAQGKPLRHESFLPILDTDCFEIERLKAALAEARGLIRDADQELRLIRSKDCDRVYDPTLRFRLHAALSAASDSQPTAEVPHSYLCAASTEGNPIKIGPCDCRKASDSQPGTGENGK